jgi:hypothetical protein
MGAARFTLHVAVAAIAWVSLAHAAVTEDSADGLRRAWAAAHSDTAFAEPLRLSSSQESGALDGTLYGVVDRPFPDVASALADGEAWCAVLVLDPNVHRCQSQPTRVQIAFGQSETPVQFAFRPVARLDDYVQVRLTAASGPFGTKDYAISFEAAPLDAAHSIVHLSFSQRFGFAARVAMLAYFNTVGRGKVGFSVVDRDAAGQPVYVGDLRGGLERNMVRYYFAILAYLDSLDAPRGEQPDRRVRAWLAYTQRYPLQLREDADYFARKSPDVRRQHLGS